MPGKKKDISYSEYEKELNRQIREQDFYHVTLICGNEDYLRTKNANALSTAILGEGDTMNINYFHGKDADVGEILSLAQTLPFFSERRVIVLEETGFFAGGRKQKEAAENDEEPEITDAAAAGQQGTAAAALRPASPADSADRLAAAMASIPETTYYVFKESDVNGSMKLYRAVKKYGWIMRCDTPDPNYLRRFVSDTMRSFHMPITPRGAALLLAYTGQNMLNIRNECRKLSDYCLGQQQATDADVQAICCITVQDRIFDMMTAIVSGNQKQALQIYMELLSLQTKPQLILALMIRQFNQLLQIGELQAEGVPSDEIANDFHLNRWVLDNRILPLVHGKSAYKLQLALQSCVQANMDYRRGRIDAQVVTEKLIVRWSTPGALANV